MRAGHFLDQYPLPAYDTFPMQQTPHEILENLTAIVDKFDNPELFSFLDYFELESDMAPRADRITKNAVVSVDAPNTSGNGIVTDVNEGTCTCNLYGSQTVFPISRVALSERAIKTLPVEWAERGAWGDARRFLLKTLSYYLFLAHSFDKIQSLSNSRTQILGHQIESTYKIVKSINPRFLIADEVGLGKTVEAGLVIKEFMIRHGYSRVMIVVPASLQFQWQQEMLEKFNERFVIVDSRTLSKLDRVFPEKAIVSLDFAKQERVRELIRKKKWDTIVFDEAHKLRRDGQTKTQAYDFAEEMSRKTHVLLLLSATPFSGKIEELYYLIRLLNPSILGSFNKFTLDYTSGKRDDLKTKLESVLIRRRKVEVGGFTRRLAKTVTFEFTEEERALYDRTTEYIRNEYDKALATNNRMHSFVLCVYQKMLDSSSHAIIHTFAARAEYLERVLAARESTHAALERESRMIGKLEEALDSGEDSEDADSLAGCGYSKEAIEEMERELACLKEIHALALKIRVNKKGEILAKIVGTILARNRNEKILIFTQFARTQEYLVDLLKEYKVSVFNGSMDKKAKDRAIVAFQNKTNILISTEAGGEGRNLQFCRYLVNYDLPWNPQKIEQRIGRLHRFGQSKDVRIYNFATKDTIGARILDVLENKIRIFEDSIGATDTLLGYYEDEIDFNSTFMKFHTNPAKVHEEIDGKIAKMKESFSHLEELTAHKVLDFNLDGFYDVTNSERAISNSLIRVMMEEYALLDGSGLSISRVEGKEGLYKLADSTSGEAQKGYFESREAVLHSESDFFAFGNPIVDSCSKRMRELSFLGLAARIRMKVPAVNTTSSGAIFNFIVSMRGNRTSRSLVPVFVDEDFSIDPGTEESIVSEFLSFRFTEDVDRNTPDLEPSTLRKSFEGALLSLEIKIKAFTEEVKKDIDNQVRLTIPLLDRHYESIITELEDLLQVQKSKEKIYNIQAFKSIIKRTQNKIEAFKKQRDIEMDKIKGSTFIHTSYQLLNIALVRVN
jgi:superfamily II DNA or RNA helicase